MSGDSLNLTYPSNIDDNINEFVFETNQSFGFRIIFHSILLPGEDDIIIVSDDETVIDSLQGPADEVDNIFIAGNKIRFAVTRRNEIRLEIEVISIDLTGKYVFIIVMIVKVKWYTIWLL